MFRSALLAASAVLLTNGLAGCASQPCDDLPPYANSREAPLLRVPGDLDAPDTSSQLELPDAPGSGRIAPCSDLPPSQQGQAAEDEEDGDAN